MESVSSLALKALALLLAFVAPFQAIMLATGVLVIADTTTGCWAAIKEGKRLTSHKLKRVLAKTTAYWLAILVGAVIENYMVEGVPLIKTVAGLIAITEGKSIFENLHRITGVDYWKLLLDKLQGSSIKPPEDQK